MKTRRLEFPTSGNSSIVDVTPALQEIVEEEALNDAVLFLSVIGSTAALSTMEYEPGLISDTQAMLDELFPYKKDYAHNLTWNDDNAHSHLRSTFLKTQMCVSVSSRKLDLGTWQQVVLFDFDTRPRTRAIVVKILT
jgi:secondary thiamine-phosphate synthase enzyme